jgi:hypothetical protein
MDLAAAAWTPQELLDLLMEWEDLKVHARDLAAAREDGNAVAAGYAERGIAEIGELTAVDALRAGERLARVVADWRDRLVSEARAAGASWSVVGDALGLTRQAAWAAYHGAGEAPDPESDL